MNSSDLESAATDPNCWRDTVLYTPLEHDRLRAVVLDLLGLAFKAGALANYNAFGWAVLAIHEGNHLAGYSDMDAYDWDDECLTCLRR